MEWFPSATHCERDQVGARLEFQSQCHLFVLCVRH
jgi:hypothetical protein